MTQPHLLELAKQGDPHAIATLMNVTLEPQGVTAEAFIEAECLSIFLSASRPLNAKTLVAFVQRGILRLEASSIQQVQIYGQRLGDEEPAWIEAFTVNQSQTAEVLEPLSHPSDSSASDPSASQPASAPQLSGDRSTRLETWKQRWLAKAHIQAPAQASVSSVAAAFHLAGQMIADLPWHDRSSKEQPSAVQTDDRAVNYLKLSGLVTLVAFVTGGAAALIAHSYTLGGSERQAGRNPSAIAAGNQTSIKADPERTRDQQQIAARSYLEAMNKAQRIFYRQNNRFASTLEELERFAAAPIAVRSDYTYKLTVPNSNQSQLTAIPKAEGLKSYTAAVAIAKPTNQPIMTICASQQAAKVPPLVFRSTNGAVQCPAEPVKAS